MNILLIGFKNDIDFVNKTIKNPQLISQTVIWDKNGGPDVLTAGHLSQFNCVIIAIKDPAFSQDLLALLQLIPCNADYIIDFYQLYQACLPLVKVDRIMTNHPDLPYNGMILGISHSEVGLIPRCFTGSVCNLAITSQDMYFNYKTFEYCLSQYPNKIKNLEYIIFDLYDYTYFNFDTSLSKNAVLYYSLGGYLDAHNFERNSSFSCSYQDAINHIYSQKCGAITPNLWNLWNDLFPDIYTQYDHLEFPSISTAYLRTNIIQEKDIENYYANASIVEKIYYDTISENIRHFYALLDTVYKNFPQIKVYLLLMPRYYYAQEKGNALYPQYVQWKEMFDTILQEANLTYPFTFLNFKNHEISRERKYYYDTSHFNYYGAVTFSKLLNDQIQ